MEKTPTRKVSQVQDRTPAAAGGDLPETTFACRFSSGEALASRRGSAWGSGLWAPSARPREQRVQPLGETAVVTHPRKANTSREGT